MKTKVSFKNFSAVFYGGGFSMYGFYNRILKINLSIQRFDIEVTDDKICRTYLGGKGLASYLLYTLNPGGVDPLSPDNCIIFATGPVTGSVIWGSSRYGVFTKSPQTGLYSESYSGGRVPEAIDATGFDAIVIMGNAEKPVVIEVHPDGALFHDAGDIWGMQTYDAEDAVNHRFGGLGKKGEKTGSVVIGPAGEKLVCFAVIENDHWRSAGRTGVGTVMGSKKLKAVLFKGNKKRLLSAGKNINKFSKQISEESKNKPSVLAFRAWGTPNMVRKTNMAGAFPTRYWAEGSFDGWENISAEALHERCEVKPHSCPKCFISCGRMTTVVNGRHAGLRIEGPEYETIYAFGGLCLIDSIEEIIYLNDICDRLGMDTITAGNLCAFTIEASKREKTDFNIDYGDVDAIAALLKMIAKREGIGDILARGIRYAAKEWGLEDLAVHVKGLEPPGYDPRVLKGSGLAFAVSERGACHLRATFHNPELTGLVKANVIKGKAAMFVDFEDRLTLMDVLIMCRFYRDQCTWEGLSQLVQLTTGLNENKEALQKRASEITDLIRCFNIREGMRPEDDNLPERLYKKFSKTGNTITKDEFRAMLKDYYYLRGWDQNGIPVKVEK